MSLINCSHCSASNGKVETVEVRTSWCLFVSMTVTESRKPGRTGSSVSQAAKQFISKSSRDTMMWIVLNVVPVVLLELVSWIATYETTKKNLSTVLGN